MRLGAFARSNHLHGERYAEHYADRVDTIRIGKGQCAPFAMRKGRKCFGDSGPWPNDGARRRTTSPLQVLAKSDKVAAHWAE